MRGNALPLDVDESGFTLVDALISLVVLMIVLLPVGGLLTTSTKVIQNSQSVGVADNLAQARLDQERLAMDSDAGFASLSNAAPTYDGSCTGAGAVPYETGRTNEGYDLTGCTTVGSVSYAVWEWRGWCGLDTATQTWGTTAASATNPGEFFVKVRVTWTATLPSPAAVVPDGERVVLSSSVPVPSGSTISTSSVTTGSCQLAT